MRNLRTQLVILFALFALVFPIIAIAGTTEFRVLFDADNDVATGCTVGGMDGVDQVLFTQVTDIETSASVTQTHRLVCTAGVLGDPIDIITPGWPAGWSSSSGMMLVETRIPFAAFGSTSMPGEMRLGLDGTRGTGSFSALTQPNGDPILFPTQSHRRRAVGFPGDDRMIVMDGIDTDWGLISALSEGTAESGTSAIKLIRAFGFANPLDSFVYFNFNVNLSGSGILAVDDSYTRTQGQNLSVAAPGVLASDQPNTLPLTAAKVSEPFFGTVSLNPDGSFVYSPSSPSSLQADSFKYKAMSGTEESNVAAVRINVRSVNKAPVITTAATNTTVCNGATATFTAAASGTPSPSVQWSVSTDGGVLFTDIPGATTGTLSFVANTSQNGNQYRATFTNSQGSAQTTATLTVTTPPAVTTHPVSQTICAGSPVTFTATASGSPTPTVQWQVDSGSGFTNMPGETNPTLTFVTAAADNAKQYRAIFTNACGTATTAAATLTVTTVTVNPATLPNATQDVAYGPHTITAVGGVGAYTFSTVPADLPPGMNLTSGGVISGTPTTPGVFNFTITATDTNGCTGNRAYTVSVCVTPSVSIVADATTFCAGTNVTFTATPVNGGSSPSYQWQVNGGSVGTNSPTFATTALSNGDQVTVVMTSNATPCTSANPVMSNAITVTVNPNPATPTITPTPAQVCAGSTGNTADGPAGATTYAWSIVNGTITSATNIQNITYTAGASGTVDLTLVVTNASGCSATNTSNVTVNPTPATPTITPTPSQVCASSTGNSAAGPAGATTYAWSIVNGTITSATNIQTIAYTAGASGTTDLTLVVTNASGCSATNTVNVTINANPAVPTITPTPAQVCASSTGNAANGPAGATTYAWSIVNGTITSATNIQTITYTAGASGTVDLTLVVTNGAGCSATNTANVTINANPAVPTITPTPAQVCGGSTGNSADGPVGATTYAWSIVNGTITSATNIQTITYTAGATGTVDLTLVVTNASGCSASNTANVPINASPATPTITPTPAQVCASSTGNSAAGPPGATTYAWSIVNGTITSATNIQTITYTAGASGTVDLTLVVTNSSSCSATNTVNVTINANPATPTITPTPAQVCANSTGNTADGPAGATTYAWSIVNGTITSATNIQTITYTAGASGTVDLTLVVTNAAGCSATNTVNVTINANPTTPTITPTPAAVCESSTGNSAVGPAGATTYAWSIVNGTITSATNIQTITYTAGASGTVDLTLVVTNASGCSATNTVNVTINPSPSTPAITPAPAQVCGGSTGNTADGPAGATTYAWSIVNGTITSATNIQTITYTAGASGTVDLTLVVTNAGGCPRSNTVNVTINPSPSTPTITPTPAQVCANATGNTADGPAGATTYAWSIVNGTITSATNIQTITYTAGASGTVDLTLVVTNGAGCPASNTVNVTINANPSTPTIMPTPAQVCANSTGNSAAGTAGATTYAWSIVNGTITSATNIQTITYTAGASGTVDLTLVVTNAAGCSATNTVNVTINASPATPTITPTPSPVCGGSTGNSAAGPAGATTYAWSIVNGTITSATNIQTITYTAGASGTVDLTLVVTNASACSASNTVNVPINASPSTPAITPTPAAVCANSTGNSAAGPAGATTYAWSIVNGTITSATNIQTITYTAGASGTVDLTLVVTNASGCSTSNTVSVTINANPTTPTITPTPAQVCANSTGNSAAGPAGATTYAWSIANGTITSATNIQTITYTAGASGTVGLTLVVTNAAGCSATNTVNVTINANPANPTITPTPASVCGGSTGNTATGPAGATTYAWSIVNGTITSATNIQAITYTAGATGTVDLTLVVTNAATCSASNTVNVPINASPATPTITPSPATEVCANTTGNTAAGPAGATTYAWSITNGTITSATNIQNITWTAGASGTVNLQLTVTNASGCATSNTANIAINPAVTLSPAPGALPDAIYQSGYSQAFTAAGGTPGFTYSISAAPSDLSFDTNTGVLSGTAPTLPNAVGVFNFDVTATDSKGCSMTQSYTLTVRPKAVNDTYNSPNAVGNTQAMTTAYTPAPTTPKVSYSGTILDNDASNAAMTVSAGAACNSGVIAFNSNGNWLYTPGVNFTGTATCGYTLTSNSVTNTANVVITISNRVWWIDTLSGIAGDGRSNTPWNNTNAITGTNAGDILYIYNNGGTTTNARTKITLLANQSLVGEGVALTVNTVLLRAAGTAPTITNAVGGSPRDTIVISNGNFITGVTLTSSETTASIITGAPAGLTVTNVTITPSSSMMGLNLTGGSGTVALTNVTMTGTGTGDMVKVNTGTHQLNFVNSPISQTGGRALNVTNKTANGMNFDSTSPITVSAGSVDGAVTLTSNSGSSNSFIFNKKIALTMTGTARGLVVGGTGTGTLNILDGTSTIVSATGSAIDIAGSTFTALNVTLEKVSVNGAGTGMLLSNTGGSFTINGVAAAGSGGVIQNCTVRGARFINASNIHLNRMTFTNNGTNQGTCGDVGAVSTNNTDCGAAIDLQTVNIVSIDDTTVTGGAQQGINGNTVTALTMNNTDVTGAGNATFENGVTMVNLMGTCSVTNGDFTNSFSRQWEIQNFTGTMNLTVSGGSFNYSTPATGTNAYGFHISAQGGANNTVTVTGAQFVNNFSAGFRSDSANSATLNATVGDDNNAALGNTFTNNGISVQILINNASDTNFDLGRNTMTQAGLAAGATNVIIRKGSGTTGTVDGQIVANNIGNATTNSGSGCGACNGISLQNDGNSGDFIVDVTNNIIQHVRQRAIELLPGFSDRSKVVIQGNTISSPDQATGLGEAIFLQSGINAGDTTTVCATVGGAGGLKNTISGTWNASNPANGAIRVRNRFAGTVFVLPGYAGGGSDTAAVKAFIEGNNTMGGNIASATINGNTFGGTCPF